MTSIGGYSNSRMSVKQHLHASTRQDIEYQLEREIVQFEASNNEAITDKQNLEWMVCKVALQLVKTFQQDEVIFLPEVHAVFYCLVNSTTGQFPNVQKLLKTNPPGK